MCFKPKRNPAVDRQLEEQRKEAEAAKAKAQEDIKQQKEKALEEAKQSEAAKTTAQVTEGQEYRQSETMAGEKAPTSLVDSNKSAAALSRSRRSSRSGRRSLITASTGQGYFSRFL